MDLVVSKAALFKELQYVQGVVEKKTTVPILSNVLLETSGNGLVVTATDLDVTVQCGCGAGVRVSGAVTVSSKKLFELVRLLPESEVHFKATSPEWMSIQCERSRFKVASLGKENFPSVPVVTGPTVRISASALRYMIARCTFAITQEESRYTLNGALMMLRPDNLSFVTTDGHRLVFISRAVEVQGQEGEGRFLVPKKTLVELGRLVAEGVESVEFGQTENHLFFRVGERLLVSRVLTGQFPNYELVIPRENNRQASIDTVELSDAVRRMLVMADEESRGVKFSFKEGQLDLASTSATSGEAKESLPADFAGDQLDISFNAQYLLDFLGVLESDQVLFEMRNDEIQALLKPRFPGDYVYQYVVMPMKV